MNAERRAVVEGAVEVLQSVGNGHGLTRAITRMVEGVLARELKSVKAMEPFKDKPTTARNYRNACVAVERLEGALAGLKKKDFEGAITSLDDALRPAATATQTDVEPVKKTKKKGKKA